MTRRNDPTDGQTAGDAVAAKAAKMRDDPEYRAAVEAADAKRRAVAEELTAAEAPIVKDLREAGYLVSSVWDLVNTSDPYFDALPVLLTHLERGGYPDRVLESLARALAVKPSVTVWERLKVLYERATGRFEQDGLAAALAASATRKQFESLVELVTETSHGKSRIHFLRPIKRVGGSRGRQVLESLHKDPDLAQEVDRVLRRTRG